MSCGPPPLSFRPLAIQTEGLVNGLAAVATVAAVATAAAFLNYPSFHSVIDHCFWDFKFDLLESDPLPGLVH